MIISVLMGLSPASHAAEELPPIQESDIPSKDKNPSAETLKFKATKRDFEERLMDNLPLIRTMKPVWHIVDGKTDLIGIENLRADRRNKGLSYTTQTLPVIGKTDIMTLKFQAGDDVGVSFESNHVPFYGKMDGFRLQGSIKNDESRIFARYTVPLNF